MCLLTIYNRVSNYVDVFSTKARLPKCSIAVWDFFLLSIEDPIFISRPHFLHKIFSTN